MTTIYRLIFKIFIYFCFIKKIESSYNNYYSTKLTTTTTTLSIDGNDNNNNYQRRNNNFINNKKNLINLVANSKRTNSNKLDNINYNNYNNNNKPYSSKYIQNINSKLPWQVSVFQKLLSLFHKPHNSSLDYNNDNFDNKNSNYGDRINNWISSKNNNTFSFMKIIINHFSLFAKNVFTFGSTYKGFFVLTVKAAFFTWIGNL